MAFVKNSKVVEPRDLDTYAKEGVKYEEGHFVNSRGMQLFTTHWAPKDKDPTALVFLLHGYAVDCGLFWEHLGVKFAKSGLAAFGIDYEGHGRSDGLHGLVPSMDQLAADVDAYFKTVYEQPQYTNKKRFLVGESMGGAMCILLSWKSPQAYNGAVLVAPMCKIHEKLKPPAPVVAVLLLLARLLPTWPVAPVEHVIDKANRDPEKRQKIKDLPTTYLPKPRLATAAQLLKTSNLIESKLGEFVLPFLVLHGSADTVTDPDISRELYDKSQSTDKEMKIYPDMWHGLTAGELDQNIDSVFADMLSWIGHRSS